MIDFPTATLRLLPPVPSVAFCAMSRSPVCEASDVKISVPPVTEIKPVLLNPPAGLTRATVAVLLVSVPLLLNTLPVPLFCKSGLGLLPARSQSPSLLTTPPPLNSTWPAPVVVTVPVAALVQVLFSTGVPDTVVTPVVVSKPVPASVPLLRLNALPIVTFPVPASVPPIRFTDPAAPIPRVLPVSNEVIPATRFNAPLPVTLAPLPRVWLALNCRVPLLVL